MKVIFHPEVEDEFVDAISYYESCEPGLGIDFSREVAVAIQNVADYPETWPTVEEEVHRCLVHRFPYGILYNHESKAIHILAVMNLHRDPDYWKHRLA
ncbi:MAG: type II toxin-antitoxin system RelE/ParE family toxin [Verrucomicrobiota bacterium]